MNSRSGPATADLQTGVAGLSSAEAAGAAPNSVTQRYPQALARRLRRADDATAAWVIGALIGTTLIFTLAMDTIKLAVFAGNAARGCRRA
jgi:hypothetical protein